MANLKKRIERLERRQARESLEDAMDLVCPEKTPFLSVLGGNQRFRHVAEKVQRGWRRERIAEFFGISVSTVRRDYVRHLSTPVEPARREEWQTEILPTR